MALPIGLPWKRELSLRSFEPENPKLFVPRRFGIDWDLNFGAVAAKLGIIRPDDSLPDLAPYVPKGLSRALTTAPWILAAANGVLAAKLATKKGAVINWSLTGNPKDYASGKTVAAIAGGVSAASLLLPALGAALDNKESDPSVDLATASQDLGLQTLVTMLLVGTLRERNEPGKRQMLVATAPLALFAVTGTAFVGTVKAALNQVSASLRN